MSKTLLCHMLRLWQDARWFCKWHIKLYFLNWRQRIRDVRHIGCERRQKIVIYTCVFGGYDKIANTVKQSVECDFILFTDWAELNTGHKHKGWRVVHYAGRFDARTTSRYFKLTPHKSPELNSYDTLVYVDGHLRIKSPYFLASLLQGTKALRFFNHPTRSTVNEELRYREICLGDASLEKASKLANQSSVLFAGGVIVREESIFSDFNEQWFELFIEGGATRDQIFIDMAAERTNEIISPISYGMYGGKYFIFIPHRANC